MARFTHISIVEQTTGHFGCPSQVTVASRHGSAKAAPYTSHVTRGPASSFDGAREPKPGDRLATYRDGDTWYALAPRGA